MKPIKRNKFEIYTNNTDTVVVVGYDNYGVRFKASAKLMPGDTFNYETGVELAMARCKMQMAKANFVCERRWADNGMKNLELIQKKVDKAICRAEAAEEDYLAAKAKVDEILNKI